MPRWFVCTVDGFGDMWVKALTHGKARYKCVSVGWDAGYSLKFGDVQVRLDRSGLEPLQGTILR